jgi:hypothetical protein
MRNTPQKFPKTKKMEKVTYGICHHVKGSEGFFALNLTSRDCPDAETAVRMAREFCEAAGNQSYTPTITKHYSYWGYYQSILHPVLGVSPDGQPHENCGFNEFPVAWITEDEWDRADTIERIKMLRDCHASYFKYTPEKDREVYASFYEKTKS